LGLIWGVAPNAYLGNYKVFTDDFTTLEQIISALEASVEDGMDIVNLSLGSESYINELLDPEALAIRNAIKAGVVIVAAVGNSGQSETIGSPGQIPEVITVGSLTNAHNTDNPQDHSIAMMDVYADGMQIIKDQELVLAQDPDFFSTLRLTLLSSSRSSLSSIWRLVVNWPSVALKGEELGAKFICRVGSPM